MTRMSSGRMGPEVRSGWARASAAGTGGSDECAGGAQIMKSRGRRLSVKDKMESKPSGVPRLRVLPALCAALLVVGVAAGCGSNNVEQHQLGRQLGRIEHDVEPDAAKSGDQQVSAGVSDYPDYVGATSSGAADQQQVADRHRLGQPAGRPDRRRSRRHQGRRPRGQVPQREAGRHRRSPREAVQVLHLDVRGAGSGLRPEDGQQQGRQGHHHGRGRDRRPVPGRDGQRHEADGLERRDRCCRCEEQERLRPLRRRHPRLGPVRHLRVEGRRRRSRSRSSGPSSPASTRARRRSSMAPRSWA